MAREIRKSNGKLPQLVVFQLPLETGKPAFGPYLSRQPEVAYMSKLKNIEFKLCEKTGNYIRQTPIQDFEK